MAKKETMHQKIERLEKENAILKEQLEKTQGYLDEERLLSARLVDEQDDKFKNSSYCQQLLKNIDNLKTQNALIEKHNETLRSAHDIQVDKIEHLSKLLEEMSMKSGIPIENVSLLETNMGGMPGKDYLEMLALQNGFDSYEDMKEEIK